MPWKETTPVDERTRFICALESCEFTMTELCRAFGISRKSGYKWAQRFATAGWEGLQDRSRAPRSCPHGTDPRCVEALVAERRSHPTWGARKLLVRLRREKPDWPWPAVSTGSEILKRHGLVEPRRYRERRAPSPKPHVQAVAPNSLWSVDYKGQFFTGDHQLCYPLTVIDRFSRFLLGCDGNRGLDTAATRPRFERLFREYGLPEAILADLGIPFGSPTSPRHLAPLSVWWVRLGIEPIYTQPGRPDQNGGHERFHRTLKAETTRPPKADLAAQQKAFDRFRQEFNQERPHESLDMIVPAELYQPSPRPYPERLPPVEYPGHFEVRSVHHHGYVRFRGKAPFFTHVLRGQRIGLEEVDDGLWSVYFTKLLLGRYDEREGQFVLL